MGTKARILALEKNRRNLELLAGFLEKEGYETIAVSELEELDRALQHDSPVNLALIDVAGFDRTVWKRCEALRAANIPFLVISPRQSAALRQMSLEHGAEGVLVKPLAVRELLGLIRQLVGSDR